MPIYGVSYSEVYNRYITVEASNAEEAEDKFREVVESDADDVWVDDVYLEEEEEEDDEYDEESDAEDGEEPDDEDGEDPEEDTK